MKPKLLYLLLILLCYACRKEIPINQENTTAATKATAEAATAPASGTIIVQSKSFYGTKHVIAIDAATGAERWKVQIIQGTLNDGGPCVANGMVYVLTDYMFYGFRITDGSQVFKTRLENALVTRSSPLYAGGMLFGACQHGMYRFDPNTGKIIWSFDARGGQGNYFNSPVYVNGKLYCNDNHYLFVFDAASGAVLRQDSIVSAFPEFGRPLPQSSPAYKNGILYFAPKDSGLLATDTSGKRLWAFPFSDCDGFSSPNIGKNTIVVHAGTENLSGTYYTGSIYAVNLLTGQQKWKYFIDDKRNSVYPTGNEFCTDSLVFVALRDSLLALDIRKGTKRWGYRSYSSNTNFSSPTALGNYVYCGSANGVYAFNIKTGTLRWIYGFPSGETGGITSGPIILTNTGKTIHPAESGMEQ